MTTQYQDDIVMEGGSDSAGGAEDLLTVEGTFICEIAELIPFMGTKFQSDEPEQKIRVVYRTTDDPANNGWNGYRIDEIVKFVKNLANEKARMHHIYKVATGVTPQPSQQYPLKRDLIGKRVKVEAGTRVSATGTAWPKVMAVLPVRAAPPPPPPRKAAAPADGLPADPLADA